MPDVYGYGWKAGKSKQVVFLGATDGHLHELSRAGGPWQHADLTALSGAPAPYFGWPIGYAWEAMKSKHVVFLTKDRHIHELSMEIGGQWSHADLTEITGAPLPKVDSYRRSVFGYGWEAAKTRQIVFMTEDEHIHELSMNVWEERWNHADLTATTGAPTGGIIAAYAWEAGKSKQVVFRGGGHVHELYVTTGGSWKYADLTKISGAPDATAVFDAYAWEAGQSKQVVFWTEDSHIHELYVRPGGAWAHADLTQLAGAPLPYVVINAYAWEAGKSKQVVFLGSSQNAQEVHELFVGVGGKWSHANLTGFAGAPLVCTSFVPIFGRNEAHGYAWEDGPAKQVVFIASSAVGYHIHELWTSGGKWTDADLTQITGAPLAASECA
jgi:hypothetical protein